MKNIEYADSRKNSLPKAIEERLLMVKRARLKAKLNGNNDQVLAAKKKLLKAKLARL